MAAGVLLEEELDDESEELEELDELDESDEVLAAAGVLDVSAAPLPRLSVR